MKVLKDNYERISRSVDLSFKRYLYHEIEFSTRLIIISGSRGVGKTTLLLQYLKEQNAGIYISLDHIYFATNTLLETVDDLYNEGYRLIAIDEVHKYIGWSRELKNIYDGYPDLKLLVTSSSALDIMSGEADLSRRADLYELLGMSFREYLEYEHGIKINPLSIDDIVKNHVSIATDLALAFSPLKYFKNYLKKGYYPFYKETGKKYHSRIMSLMNQVIESDLPPIFNMDYSSVRQIKKLLGIIAKVAPFSPNISNLARDLEISRNRVLEFIDYLDRAGLLNVLKTAQKSDSAMSKPDKIFLENPNLIFALALEQNNTGTERESFFMGAVKAKNEVFTPAKGDFMVNHSYVFEVGGKNKSFHQIKDMPNAFLAKDDLEIGYSSTIPLWLFGLLY
jgi:predicted AAA+ superfamily ATPase